MPAPTIDLMGEGSMMKPKGVKSDAEETAVQDMFKAGQSGDWAAAAAAFKRAYDICSGESAEGSEYGE